MSSARPAQVLLRHLANLFAPGLVFLPSYVAFVQFQGYPLWRPEVLIIAGLVLIAGLPFGLLLSLRPRTFGAATAVLVLIVLAMQIFDEGTFDVLSSWGNLSQDLIAWAGPIGGIALSVLITLLIAAVPFAVLSWLGPNLGIVLATIFSVTLVSSLLLPAEPPPLGETYRRDAGPAKDLPPIIHLVFDEQIGVEGLPADIVGSDELRDELRRLYEDFGFTLYGGAYSEYSRTRHSLISLLNGYDSLDGKIPDGRQELFRMYSDNQWFKILAERGYLIHAYQIHAWDYCGGEAGYTTRCVTYSDGSIASIEDTDLTVDAKVRVILVSYLHSLALYKVFKVLSGPAGLPPHMLPDQQNFHAADSVGVLEQMLTDIRAAPRGTAYFAHLLIPHGTHILDQDCKIRTDPLTWTSFGDLDLLTGDLNSAASREARYINYFAQVRCLQTAFRRFLEGLKEIGVFEDATIVVHGDHGSRIARVAPLTTTPQPLSDEDLADMYSVLFAVRLPSLAPGYRQDLVSLQALFRELFLGGTPRDRPPEIYLDYPASINTSLTKPPFPRRPMSDFRRTPNSP